MSAERKLFIWKYFLDNGSEIYFEIPCRKLEQVSESEFRIGFRLQDQIHRERVVEDSELAGFTPTNLKVALEFTVQKSRVWIVEATSSFGQKFYYPQLAESVSESHIYFDSPIQAIVFFLEGSKSVDKNSVRISSQEFSWILEEAFADARIQGASSSIAIEPPKRTSEGEWEELADRFLTYEVAYRELPSGYGSERVPKKHLHLKLPAFQRGLFPEQLELNDWVGELVKRHGLLDDFNSIVGKSLEDLVRIPRLGNEGLLRLLYKIRAWIPERDELETFLLTGLLAKTEGYQDENLLSREDIHRLRYAGPSRLEVLRTLKQKYLPKLREGWTFDKSRLPARLIDDEEMYWWIDKPSILSGKKVGELCRLKHVGEKVAADLLLMLDFVFEDGSVRPNSDGSGAPNPEEASLLRTKVEEAINGLEGIEINRDDPIWGARIVGIDEEAATLRAIVLGYRDASDEELLSRRSQVESIETLAHDLRSFQRMSVSEQLLKIGRSLANQGSAITFLMKTGILTGHPMTFKEIAEQEGASSQSVKRRCEKISTRLLAGTTYFPGLDKAVGVLRSSVGQNVSIVERRLAEESPPHAPPTVKAVLGLLEEFPRGFRAVIGEGGILAER